jgi:hypothetical protein
MRGLFESVSNLIFILIPLAIFIGRIVVQAKNKREQPPQIPVHFEDEEDSEYSEESPLVNAAQTQKRDVAVVPPKPTFSPTTQLIAGEDSGFHSKVQELYRTPKKVPAANVPVVPEEKSFALNLNHLSPMKQAVVMAEILGSPKGMS